MLDGGMLFFYHKNNGELVSYPEGLEDSGYEDDWADETKKVKDAPDDYVQFVKASSREAFKLMEGFIDNIDHIPTRNKFINAISRKKPFANFNDMLRYYPALRQQWFDYKLLNSIEHLQRQIDLFAMPPFNKSFCQELEYHLTRTFQNASTNKFDTIWCDGIAMPSLEDHNDVQTNQISTDAWLGTNGQEKYTMLIKLGPLSVAAFEHGLNLSDCLPSDQTQDWITLDQEDKTIELRLR